MFSLFNLKKEYLLFIVSKYVLIKIITIPLILKARLIKLFH